MKTQRLVHTVLAVMLINGCAMATVQFAPGVGLGPVANPAIDEASGLAVSRRNSGVLWTHNDSGGAARVYAMGTDGADLGWFDLSGVTNRDWEDLAIGPGPTANVDYLYIGDIGDNNAVHSSVAVHRFAEPAVAAGQPQTGTVAAVDTITLTYPDGPRDAETLMVDPTTGDLYIFTKHAGPGLYYAPASALVDGANVALQRKATLSWTGDLTQLATGGDISHDGNEILIRRYLDAFLFTRPAGGDLWDALAQPGQSVPLLFEPQGEAIAFDAEGSYYTVSEYGYTSGPVAVNYFQRVPEPTVLAMLNVVVLGVLARRRR